MKKLHRVEYLTRNWTEVEYDPDTETVEDALAEHTSEYVDEIVDVKEV